MRKLVTILLSAAGLVSVAPAQASELEAAPAQRLQVHGDVTQHCSITSPDNVDFGNLQRDGLQAELSLGLNCNLPFVMLVEAQNGALTNLQYPKGQGPYSGSLPYVLDFSIPTRAPSAKIITDTFNSRDLVGGKSISSQGAIATDGMKIHVALGHAGGEAGLLAGDYGETITITLSST